MRRAETGQPPHVVPPPNGGHRRMRPHTAPVLDRGGVSAPSSSTSTGPWGQDLEELQAETLDVLQRFGSSKSSRRKSSTRTSSLSRQGSFPPPPSLRRRPPTSSSGASASSGYAKRPWTKASVSGTRRSESNSRLNAIRELAPNSQSSHAVVGAEEDEGDGDDLATAAAAATTIQTAYRGKLGRIRSEIVKVTSSFGVGHGTGTGTGTGNEEGEWILVTDDANDEAWYYNVSTGESRWDDPMTTAAEPSQSRRVGRRSWRKKSAAERYEALPPVSSLPDGSVPSSTTQGCAISSDRYGNGNCAVFPPLSKMTTTATDSVRNREDCGEREKKSFGVDDDDGINKTNPPLLLDAIENALRTSKYDSVSALIASGGGGGGHRHRPSTALLLGSENGGIIPTTAGRFSGMIGGRGAARPRTAAVFRRDEGRHPMMASTMRSNRGHLPSRQQHGNSNKAMFSLLGGPEALALRDVDYAGFEGGHEKAAIPKDGRISNRELTEHADDNGEVCFNCWSAGRGKRCSFHVDAAGQQEGLKAGDSSVLMCKNWDIGVLCRRYRAGPAFVEKSATIFQSCTPNGAAKPKHPIQRLVVEHIAKRNFAIRRKTRVRSWFKSFIDQLKCGNVAGDRSKAATLTLQLRSTILNLLSVRKLSGQVFRRHPQPPITGTTFAEKKGKEEIVVEKDVFVNQSSVRRKYINAGPAPVPQALYQPRKYEVPPCITVPLLESGCGDESPPTRSSSSAIVPRTTKYATFGRKRAPNDLAVGGLSAEVIISQQVVTRIPPQYGNLICMDRMIVAPATSEEKSATFPTIQIEPKNQIYIERELQNPLNTRRAPTIMIVAGLDPKDRHFYGTNRPHQTGENADYGFRTSEWTELPTLDATIDPSTFVPAEEVASLNLPAENPPTMTRADRNYPFRETNSRKNSTMDFQHLLLAHGVCSSNKTQLFTAIGSQEPGYFMRQCDPTRTIGRFSSEITRSWVFVQKQPVECFFTDAGVPYWYDRRTGDTFWERPLYEEEKKPLKEGGVLFGATAHPKGASFVESSTVQNNRSELRKNILRRHETKEMVATRRATASRTPPTPEPPCEESKIESEGNGSLRQDALELPIKPTITGSDKSNGRRRRKRPSKVTECAAIDVITLERTANQLEHGDVESVKENPEAGAEKLPDGEAVRRVGAGPETETLVDSITQALGDALKDLAKPEDVLRLGMGLGVSLGAQGLLKMDLPGPCESQPPDVGDIQHETDSTGDQGNARHEVGDAHTKAEDEVSNPGNVLSGSILPEDGSQELDESGKEEESECPQETCQETQSTFCLGEAKTSTGHDSIKEYNPGRGTFDLRERSNGIVDEGGLLNAISARRVGGQYVDYLPIPLTLPTCKPVGRVKPRPAWEEWVAVGFDPWSAGKEPLSAEFVPSLSISVQARVKTSALGALDKAFIDIEDPAELQAYSDRVASENKMAHDFAELCSYIRHGKYRELEDTMHHPDWSLPIDYADEAGNTLLMICCQNGNRRMVKLCLRRGSELNRQNLNGQTCLHYAFGYGFDDLGEYLISKGADDSITNADGMTCFEGLSFQDVSHI